MTRFEAVLLVRRRIRDRALVRFCLAVEAVMEDLARRLGGDPQTWGLAGLLHELDREFTQHNPSRKGTLAADLAKIEGAPPSVCRALSAFRAPGPHTDPLANALAAAVPASTVIVELACSAREPDGLKDVDLAGILEDPSVAPQASRTRLDYLRESGIGTPELLEIARAAISRVAADVFLS
jgi:predicted hydrolase (HD superfamily)